jgi:hypothetical protein
VVFDIGSGEVWVRQGQGAPLAPRPERRGTA